MSTVKDWARGFSAAPGGVTAIGLKHPDSKTARNPVKKQNSFAAFIYIS
jgi:hypothetical protein